MCCRILQRVAVYCSMLQCAAACCRYGLRGPLHAVKTMDWCVAMCCSVLSSNKHDRLVCGSALQFNASTASD